MSVELVGVDAPRTCCSEKSLIENYLHTRIRCTQLFQNPTVEVSNFLNGEESHKRTGHESHATPRSPPGSVRNPESIRTIWGLGGLLEGPLAPFCVQKETSPHWPVALRSRPSARIRESSSHLGLDRKRYKLPSGTISQSPPESCPQVSRIPSSHKLHIVIIIGSEDCSGTIDATHPEHQRNSEQLFLSLHVFPLFVHPLVSFPSSFLPLFLCLSPHFLLSLFSFMSFFFRHHPWCFVISFVLTDSFFFSTSVFLHLFFSFSFLYIQGVSHWGVMLTQAPIWGNRGWETKFLFPAPVSLD